MSRRSGASSWRLHYLVYLAVIAGIACLIAYAYELDLIRIRLRPPRKLIDELAVAVIVGGWSAFAHARALARAGSLVVASSGARRLHASTRDPLERRLLGVVDELSVAAQLPMPAVFVLDHERSINALSACRRPADAAIGVTRGALARLTRAELQAMVAHELAHVLQGDMRLTARLLGVRLFVTQVAERVRCRAGGGSVAGFVATLVVRLLAVWLGAQLVVQVSRQRDLDADATAISLTRDPESLSSCLRKVADDRTRDGRCGMAGSELLQHLWFVAAPDEPDETDEDGDEPMHDLDDVDDSDPARRLLDKRIRRLGERYGLASLPRAAEPPRFA